MYIPHCLLINKLSNIGLNNFLLRWICSYLSDRRQKVILNGCSSDVMSGVPQGSVMGSLLFLLYIIVLEEIPLSAGTKFVLYADNIVVLRLHNLREEMHTCCLVWPLSPLQSQMLITAAD